MRGDQLHELAAVVRAVRSAVTELAYPLPAPTARDAAAQVAALRQQLDDYLLPRLAQPDAPLLVVVGGSTGSGKSTLVNSLVRVPVSAAGVLRPTTRAPVLVCHPADAHWFRSGQLLGDLPRASAGSGGSASQSGLQLIVAPALPPGLAFLDAPDIDSVAEANRSLARRLLAAADLWLFLTTPNRYADAVPWRLLHNARDRGAVLALVLSRVPPPATNELVGLVSQLLAHQGLGQLPVFVVPQTRVDRQGLLPEPATEQLRNWFHALAGDQAVRASVVRSTLDGALAALPAQLASLATALEAQMAIAESLAEQVGMAYGLARGTIERGLRTSGVIEATGAPAAGADEVIDATAVAQLVHSAVADAAEQIDSAWRTHPAGAALLTHRTPDVPSPQLSEGIAHALHDQPADRLLVKIGEVLEAEAGRWLERLAGVPLNDAPAQQLRLLASELEQARQAARLTAVDPPATQPPVADSGPPADAPPAAGSAVDDSVADHAADHESAPGAGGGVAAETISEAPAPTPARQRPASGQPRRSAEAGR